MIPQMTLVANLTRIEDEPSPITGDDYNGS